jgi:hypothetical protein
VSTEARLKIDFEKNSIRLMLHDAERESGRDAYDVMQYLNRLLSPCSLAFHSIYSNMRVERRVYISASYNIISGSLLGERGKGIGLYVESERKKAQQRPN